MKEKHRQYKDRKLKGNMTQREARNIKLEIIKQTLRTKADPDLVYRQTLISNLPSFKSTLHHYLVQSLFWFWFASIIICCWCCFILQITSGNNRVMLYLPICWFELCFCRWISDLFQFIPLGRFFQSVSSPIWMSDTPLCRPPHPYFLLHYIKHPLNWDWMLI